MAVNTSRVKSRGASITSGAREKAAAAQASANAFESEHETLRQAMRCAQEERDAARDRAAESRIEAATAAERLRISKQEHKRAIDRGIAAEQKLRMSQDQALMAASTARRILAETEEELKRVTTSRSWRWTTGLRQAGSGVRSVRVLTLAVGATILEKLGLPGAERLRVARRMSLFRRSGYFNAGWYRKAYPGVARAGVDPAWHFAARGSIERRNPSPRFDTAFYLDAHPDVAASGMHALEHYLSKGMHEGRSPRPSEPGPARPAAEQPAPPVDQHSGLEITVREPMRRIELPPVDPERLATTRAIAFYLPQFHPIPENDAWWGRGFTEWSNVTRARPMFQGHTQPMLPSELGFYDLRLPEVRERQAELARAAGIHGFCYYHYWFEGRRVLEHPLDEVLRLGSPDFPFCVCWANENWTRRWDGMEHEVLLSQAHTLASDRRFIIDLLPYLEDERYIRVGDRPVVLVYRPDLMHDAADTAAVWRDECRRAGIGDIHLCAVRFRTGDPRPLGFDAAVEFPPHHFPAPEITQKIPGLTPGFTGAVMDYRAGVESVIKRPPSPEYRLYRGVMPSWDNTARRLEAATIQHGATPELYEAWLRSAINHRQPDEHDGATLGENLVFINAWNEWAEGTVLEPRRDLGDAYLRATARVLGGDLGRQTANSEPIADDTLDAHAPSSAPRATADLSRPGSTIETKLKRVVRTNPTLNAFVNRHPELKNHAGRLVRKIGTPGPVSSSGVAARNGTRTASVRWRGTIVEGTPKLLVVSHDAALAGAQLIVLENVRHWVRDGADVRVLLLGSGPLEARFAQLCPTATTDDQPGTMRARAIRAVLEDLSFSGWKPDAAYCNTVASVDAIDELTRAGVPVTAAVYELPTSIEDSLGGRRTIDRVMKGSRRVVVASGFVRDQLASAYAIAHERLIPIHTGVLTRDLPDVKTARAEIRDELGVAPDTAIVLGCGSIHHRKGTDLFIAAAAEAARHAEQRAVQAQRPMLFVWVGEDQSGATFGNWCRHDAERIGLGDRVRFVGPRHDPGRWFAGADLFALTSREDPFPMVNLEAINAGLPVVAFEGGGGAPEILLPHNLGTVVPYADTAAFGGAIERVLHETDHAQAERSRVRTFAREALGWDTYMARLNQQLAACSDRFERSGTVAMNDKAPR
ncbi:MAG: glycoside hydrolase family 99-like domain-containing protein [Planctomycetota bacterium]